LSLLQALRQQSKTSWGFVGKLFGMFAVIGTLAAYFCERFLGDSGFPAPLAGALIGLLAPTAFFAVYIAEGITKLTDETDSPVSLKIFEDAVEAALFRLSTVIQIRVGKITSEIYCTSHCNLFANPGGPGEPNTATNNHLRVVNDAFFSHLLNLAMTPPPEKEGLKLLLQYKTAADDDVQKELRQRLGIYARTCAMRKDRDIRLARDRFEIRHLLPHSLKDYFVIEDHVFITVRKTEDSSGRTQYVYMQSRELADTYRMWLADIFEHGHEGQTPLTEKDEGLLALIKSIWEDVRSEVDMQNRKKK
jgi:hypothetical protein